MRVVILAVIGLVAITQPASADPWISDVIVRGILLDPTTYVPAAIAYSAYRADWDTSQPLFQRGFTEANPRFTVSGFPRDTPVSYREGNSRIARDAIGVLGVSLLNNAVESIVEHEFLQKNLEHRRLIRTLGWVERIAFASALAYGQSHRHFEQAAQNRRIAGSFP